LALKVLVVDDEPVARRVLIEELEFLPDVDIVGEAESGAEALEKIAVLAPDLVLLDLQMPVMTGLDVLRNLSGTAHPVVVLVTAYDHYAPQALQLGAADYLVKPVDAGRLKRVVQHASNRIHVTPH
jgi:two-component system, LytTR family, response regulator